MTSSPYLDAVTQYLRADGWEVQSRQLQTGTFLIAGRQSAGGERSIVALIVTAEAGQVTPDHLKHLLGTAREEGVDLAILAAEQPIAPELQSAAADNGVHVLDNEELDIQASGGSPGDAEATETQSTTEPASAGGEASADSVSSSEQEPAAEREPTAMVSTSSAASTGGDSFPSPRKLLESYLTAKLSRRRILAGSALLVGGTAASGYGWYRFAPSELERFKSDTEQIAYDDLQADIEPHIGTGIYFSPARVAQLIETEGGTRLRLQVTQGDGGTWQDDLLGRWDGDSYAPGDIVEFWGVVNGSVRYETSLGVTRTVPDIDIVDIATVEG